MANIGTIPVVVLAIGIVLSVASTINGLLVLRSVLGYESSFVGGKVLAVNTDGYFVETNISPSTLAAYTQPAEIVRANVLSTGAAVLNVTVEVARQGNRRSWTVVTEGDGAALTSNETIVLDLADTSVLLPSDVPLLSPLLPAYHVVPCGCYFNGTSTLYACGIVVATNGTMTIVPSYVEWYQLYDTAGFGNQHIGQVIRIASDFEWMVA